MYDNNYPDTNPEARDNGATANQSQNRGQNGYGGGYYRNPYTSNPYGQGNAGSPYENRQGYYQQADQTDAAGGISGARNMNGGVPGGSYQYSNDYAQAKGRSDQKKAEKKKNNGSYFKRALINISLGLFFGVFAGIGLYGAQTVTGMLQKDDTGRIPQLEETMSETAALEDKTTAAEKAMTEAEKAPADSGKQLNVPGSAVKTVVDVSEVAKEVMPAIVSINNHYTEKISYFGQFIINEADASGSGIIVGQNDTELLIATNYHVIADAERLTIQFAEGSEADASVKGVDPEMDLAVVAVPMKAVTKSTMDQIVVAKLGDSDALQVGEPAIAIGNSLGYGQSVTTGVISALNRTIELSDGSDGTFIQTDAAINPGNSGGALLNMSGEVIGINSNKIGGSAVEGMGYAIPISSASPIIAELMLKETKNKVAEEERGYLGISGISVTDYVSEAYGMPKGVYISQVYDNTAAAKAGLRKGDIITAFDGTSIYSMDELQRELEFHAKGDTVGITVMSAGMNGYSERKVQLTLGNKVTE